MKKEKNIMSDIVSFVFVVVLVLFIKKYVFSPIRVNGNSMNDTLLDQDIMILNEFVYRFNSVNRFDIVVVGESGELLIKRVVGLPGETIECRNNVIYINDKEIEDKYAIGVTNDFSKVRLKNDEYFLLGDNREVSLDSRTYGSYKKSEIKGQAVFTIYPFDRFGKKE